MSRTKIYSFISLIIFPALVSAGVISLQNGTATFSQTCCGTHSPDLSVDGDLNNNGWAIATFGSSGDSSSGQTAVWETSTDFDAAQMDISLMQIFGTQHILGTFRFSVTSDDRSTFADGLDNGGDVTANWTVLTNPSVSGPAGVTFSTLSDSTVLVGGSTPETATYDVQYTGNFFNITGIRLEVIENASLPFNGPGRQPSNGNFVLSDLTVTSSGTPIPESSSYGLILSGVLGFMIIIIKLR